jgi:hypothetical protein
MSYWNKEIDGCDYASGKISVLFLQIERSIEAQMAANVFNVAAALKTLALLRCLRLLGERFPKELSVRTDERSLDELRRSYMAQLQSLQQTLSIEAFRAIAAAANAEFSLFHERVFDSAKLGEKYYTNAEKNFAVIPVDPAFELSEESFESVDELLSQIVGQLMKGIDVVISKAHPEQGMLALLCCLRLLGKSFPKRLSSHFGRNDFEKVRSAFAAWTHIAGHKVPPDTLRALQSIADKEFSLFEIDFFKV